MKSSVSAAGSGALSMLSGSGAAMSALSLAAWLSPDFSGCLSCAVAPGSGAAGRFGLSESEKWPKRPTEMCSGPASASLDVSGLDVSRRLTGGRPASAGGRSTLLRGGPLSGWLPGNAFSALWICLSAPVPTRGPRRDSAKLSRSGRAVRSGIFRGEAL